MLKVRLMHIEFRDLTNEGNHPGAAKRAMLGEDENELQLLTLGQDLNSRYNNRITI
jgi:hypothetical protein